MLEEVETRVTCTATVVHLPDGSSIESRHNRLIESQFVDPVSGSTYRFRGEGTVVEMGRHGAGVCAGRQTG